MPVRVARRPIVRWILVASVLVLLLLWYSGAPSTVPRPRWTPKTPWTAPNSPNPDPKPKDPVHQQLPAAPVLDNSRLSDALKEQEEALQKANSGGHAQPEPKVGANDLDFLDTHPGMLKDPPPQDAAAKTTATPTATVATSLAMPDTAESSLHPMHAPKSSTGASSSGMHAPHKTGTADPAPSKGDSSSSVKGDFQIADDYKDHFKGLLEAKPMSVRDTKKTCSWPSVEDVNFQYGTDKEWVKNDRSDAEIAQHQKEWQDFMKSDLIPYTDVADKFSGKGIVICAGNERSLMRARVLLKMLRYFETKLPVEVHYFGDAELSAQNRTDLKALFPNLHFNDLNGPDAILNTKHTNFMINYNVKLASMMNSRFAEPMLLDSDNVPVSDPMSLYESDTYKQFGTVFYPDIARTRPENPMWAITNTECRPNEYEMESGQMVVDKRRFWYHLQLAAHFGHKDYYQEFLLGDKDCFRFAWHALKTPYGRPTRWITSIGYVARPRGHSAFPDTEAPQQPLAAKPEDPFQGGPDSFYCGHSFGQHHPDGIHAPLLFIHGGLVKTLNQEQIAYAKEHARGLFSAYKRSPRANAISDVAEKVGIKWDGGLSYLSLGPADKLDHVAQCTDMERVKPLALGDADTPEMRGFEGAFEAADGFWMLNRTMWEEGHGFWG